MILHNSINIVFLVQLFFIALSMPTKFASLDSKGKFPTISDNYIIQTPLKLSIFDISNMRLSSWIHFSSFWYFLAGSHISIYEAPHKVIAWSLCLSIASSSFLLHMSAMFWKFWPLHDVNLIAYYTKKIVNIIMTNFDTYHLPSLLTTYGWIA